MRKIVRFDGVDGCMTLACNGREVGLHKGSRLMAEFDLTEFLQDGENTICVKVIQFGDHSYIEDQDMWWLSGIFRDVTLLAEPVGGMTDIAVAASVGESPTVTVSTSSGDDHRYDGIDVYEASGWRTNRRGWRGVGRVVDRRDGAAVSVVCRTSR